MGVRNEESNNFLRVLSPLISRMLKQLFHALKTSEL